MNSLTRIMSYDKTKINQECSCSECTNIEVENQTVEYPKLSEEKIEQIINERYSYKDEKTKTFIRKALRKHGDRYDYSNVVYVRTDEKVEIICRVEGHEPFPQTPSAHKQGQGCPTCKGGVRLNKEEFIKRANKIHGIRTYDYSKVNYINMNTNVIITCPIHGDFPQTPNGHIHEKEGCPKCKSIKISESQKMTKEEFIKRAREIHGDKYDYSKVDYKYIDLNVIITCPIHGDFPQTPHNHLYGSGCSKCNTSKGENTIRNYLIEYGLNFEEQKRFEDCRDKKSLPFDFYLPQYNLCIEFDGRQHFMVVNFGHMTKEEMEENLKLNQLHDIIKTDYCKINKIHLLRIRYNEDIKKKLSEYFKITENKLSLEK